MYFVFSYEEITHKNALPTCIFQNYSLANNKSLVINHEEHKLANFVLAVEDLLWLYASVVILHFHIGPRLNGNELVLWELIIVTWQSVSSSGLSDLRSNSCHRNRSSTSTLRKKKF